MKTIKQVLNLAWKDFQIIIRDRGMLAVIIAMPLLFGLILSSAYSGGMQSENSSNIEIPIAILNQDEGRYSQTTLEILDQIDVLKITTLAKSETVESVNQMLLEGETTAVVIIPPNFSSGIEDYSGTEISLLVDPQKSDFGEILKNILDAALAPVVVEGEIRYGIRSVMEEGGITEKLTPEMVAASEAQTLGVVMTRLGSMMSNSLIPVKLETTARDPNSPINFFNLLIPGFTVMFSFFLVGVIGESIFKEKDDGTYRRLMAGPMRRGEIVAGKMLAFGVMVVLQVFILFGVAASFFSMDLGSSPLGLILLTICLSLVVTSMGLMVAAISKSGKQADSISILLAFLLAGLGGCIQFGLTPLFLQDNFIATLSRFVPQGQALWGYFRLINQNAGIVEILPNMGILLLMAAVFFGIASWRLKWN
jgi:ABC-2 type transport system permease protein